MNLHESCNNNLRYNRESGRLFWKIAPSQKPQLLGVEAGTLMSIGYRSLMILKKHYYTHRLIWLMEYGELPDIIDHIDGDRLNNRIGNLRSCTRQQNNMNVGPKSNNKTGYKGVSWHKQTSKYMARITDSGKIVHLGMFACKHEAARAYNEAALRYHGDFAYLNTIKGE